MRTEPAVATGTAAALVAAILALLVAFGVDLSPDQEKAILGVVAILGPLVSSWLIRRNVWSRASHEEEVAKARERVLGG